MAENNLLPVSDDYYDVLVDASFADNLAPSDVIKLSEIILEVAKSRVADGILFVGFAAVEVNLEKVKVQFRFSKRQQDIAKLNTPDRDELPRRMARFTWHLFAKVDDSYKLAQANLPDGFRSYVNLEE